MCTLNKPGSRFGKLAGVTAMTDVTGFRPVRAIWWKWPTAAA